MLKSGLLVLAAAALASSAAAPSATKILSSTAVTWEEIQAKGEPNARYRQVFRDPTATLDELELHVTTLPPGLSSHAPHQHPDEEIIVIKEGTLETMVNGQTRRVGPGSVIFQAANQLHSIRNAGETPAVYHVIKWNSPGMLKARQAN